MRRTLSLLFPILVLALAVGCKPKAAKWDAQAASYAVYATSIPLYPEAKIDNVMGSDSYGDTEESHTEGMCWWYKCEDPQDRIVAWYDAQLAGARREVSEDGDVTFTLQPPGGETGEDMGVIVDAGGGFRVFEHTRAGKHRS